jgi:hypothetical protein
MPQLTTVSPLESATGLARAHQLAETGKRPSSHL